MRDQRFRAVSVMDPALDLSVKDAYDYVSTRDYSRVKTHAGMKPTVFHLTEVPHGLWEEYVAAADNPRERHRRAFQSGVEKVENLVQPDGVALPSWSPSFRHPRLTNVVMMSDEECQLFSPAEREEIGSVVYQHSFLARRIKLTFRLPLSLEELLPQRTFRLVESNQSTAEGQNSAAQSASTSPNQGETANA